MASDAHPTADAPPPDDTLTSPPADLTGSGPAILLEPSAVSDPPGFEIESELGRGGMGVVYRARQTALNRTVALKMILGGQYASPTARMRFHIEAEAVARLHHPNIVQVYEIGQHEGLPFFALEFVAGGTLADKLIRDGQFDPRPAAELVATLADAIAAAHAQGVVHRDLKPANVLLNGDRGQKSEGRGQKQEDGEPESHGSGLSSVALSSGLCPLVPKVTDFGLAKVGRSDLTGSQVIMGTPSYMSPEQAAGKTRDVGTAADVWALGAILYECLTGRPPFLAETSAETVRLVLTAEPRRPRADRRDVPRDLETICLKCLQKEPTKRYPTADALAADLRAYLGGRPIAARPVGAVERTWKWAKRRPGAAAAVAAAGLVAAAFVVVVAQFNVRLQTERNAALKDRDDARTAREHALANFRLARKAVDVYTKKISDDQRLRGFGLDEVRREWLRDGEGFYREFVRQYGDDPGIEAERARTLVQLASIAAAVGSPAESADLFRQARDLQERLAADQPGVPDHRFDLSTTLLTEAGLDRKKSQRDVARPMFERCIALRADLARQHPDNAAYAFALAAAWNNYAILLKDAEETGPAEKAFLTAAGILREVPSDVKLPDDLTEGPMFLRAVLYTSLGGLYTSAGRLPEAESALLTALEHYPDCGDTPPESRDARTALGLTRFALAALYHKQAKAPGGQYLSWRFPLPRVALAEMNLRATLDLYDPIAAMYPGVPDYQNMTSAARMMLAMILNDTDRTADAEKALRRAVDGLEPLARLNGNVQHRTNLVSGYQVLGQMYAASGRPRQAEGVLTSALAVLDGLVAEYPAVAGYREKQSTVLYQLGSAFKATNRPKEAEAHYRRDLAVREVLARDAPTPANLTRLGGGLCDLGGFVRPTNPTDSLALFTRAEETLRDALAKQPDNPDAARFLRNTWAGRSATHQRLKGFPQAIADRERVIRSLENAVRKATTAETLADLADAHERLGNTFRAAGQSADAIGAYRKAVALYDDAVAADPTDADRRLALSEALGQLGLELSNGTDFAATEAAYRRAIREREAFAAAHPDHAENRVDLGGVCCNLAHLLRGGPNPADALPWYGRAVTSMRGVLDEGGTPENIRRRARAYLRNTYAGRSAALEGLSRPAEAAADQAEIVAAIIRQPTGPGEPDPLPDFAVSCDRLGELHHAAQQYPAARDAFARAAGAFEKLAARDPKVPAPRGRLAGVLEKHGKSFGAAGDFASAVPLFEKALRVREELAREFPAAADNQRALRDLSTLLARGYVVEKQPEKAEAVLTRLVALRREVVAADPKNPAPHRALAEDLWTLGVLCVDQKAHARAESVFREAADAWDRWTSLRGPAGAAEARNEIQQCQHGLGTARLLLGNLPGAAEAFGREVELREAAARAGKETAAQAVARGGSLANLALAQTDPAKSLDPYTRAAAVLRKAAANDPDDVVAADYLRKALSGRAAALTKLKRYADALADWNALADAAAADELPAVRVSRALVLARLGDHARAAAEVTELAKGTPDGGQLYNLACVLSLSAGVAGTPAEAYAAGAVQLLRRAAATGYFGVGTRVSHLAADTDLDPIRRRDDFRAFVADLVASPIDVAPSPRGK